MFIERPLCRSLEDVLVAVDLLARRLTMVDKTGSLARSSTASTSLVAQRGQHG